MKKRKGLTVEELKTRLLEVEKQIVAIETNKHNITGQTSYLNGMAYELEQVYGYAADSPSRHSHSFSLMMTDADVIELQLDDLNREKDDLIKKIQELEKVNGSGQMGI